MRRFLFPAIPVFVAGAVLVLASPAVRAQQPADTAAQPSAGHACACCGNSSSGAMNHAAGGGCCGQSTQAAATSADDHAAMDHAPAQDTTAKPAAQTGAGCCGAAAAPQTPMADMKDMDHSATGGCCGGMNHEAAASASAKPMAAQGGGCCGGMAMGHGEGGGMPMAMGDPSMPSDMQVFHFLLQNRDQIRRTVTVLPDGIDTLTESDNPEIAAKLKTHVSAMYSRLKDGRPIHQRDPLFVELFAHADQIDAKITYTEKGIRAVETSTDPAVAHLLHLHADVVNGFIKNGMPEMMKNHLE